MLCHALPYALSVSLLLILAACGQAQAPQPVIRPVMVAQPQLATQLVDSYAGEVRARLESQLAFRVAGKIHARLVEVGQRVEKDAALAELDPQDMNLQFEAAKARAQAAEANLELAGAERGRYRTLLRKQMVSQSQFDTADNGYRAAEAQLRQARAELKVMSNQADYSVLRAPQSGVIVLRSAEAGQVVAAGQQVFVLAADGEREVLIALPEQSIEPLQLGQQVAIELWSRPGERFHGRIRELSPAADSRSRTYAVRIAFTDAQVPAELGQSARVFIAHQGEVPLAVPLSALTAEQGQPYVWVVDVQRSTLKRRPVTLGPYGEKQVPVLQGLNRGDWVVTAGVQLLQEGQQVRPVDRDNRTVDLAAKD